MTKAIERAMGNQGRVQVGIKSEVFNGFASTDQMLAWKSQIEDESYADVKIKFDDVHLLNWSDDKEAQDKIAKSLSGDVHTYHIDELPEEERKKYK